VPGVRLPQAGSTGGNAPPVARRTFLEEFLQEDTR